MNKLFYISTIALIVIAISLGATGIGLALKSKIGPVGPRGLQGSEGKPGQPGPKGDASDGTKLLKMVITDVTVFDTLSEKVKKNNLVEFTFSKTLTNAQLKNKIFLGTKVIDYNGDDQFIGKLFTAEYKEFVGDYSLATTEEFKGGVQTEKIIWTVEKIEPVKKQS